MLQVDEDSFTYDNNVPEMLIESIEEYMKGQNSKETEEDIVNHPKHYNREGAMECIDEMVEVFGEEIVKNYCLCNVWKYRYRASDKNGNEDILKSDWYMKKYKELNKINKLKKEKCITVNTDKFTSFPNDLNYSQFTTSPIQPAPSYTTGTPMVDPNITITC